MVASLEASAREQFHAAQAAYEGLEIVLTDTGNMAKKLQSPSPQPIPPREGSMEVKYANYHGYQKGRYSQFAC
jgi:hypothetical protein